MHKLALLTIALLTTGSAFAQFHQYDIWTENYTAQALLGAAHFKDLKLRVPNSTEQEEVDLRTLPQIGGAWSSLPRGDRFQYGLEALFLTGFKADRISYAYLGGGGARVRVETSLWLFDLSGGGYASLFVDPGHRVRIYAGGGPLLIYANYSADHDYDDEDQDERVQDGSGGIGLYARAGIEFRTHERGMLGLSARGVWTNLDLSDIGGRSNLTGLSGFISYTAGF